MFQNISFPGLLVAVFGVAAIFALRYGVGFVTDTPFPGLIFFIIPVLLGAYVGGTGCGLIATVLSAATTNYFLLMRTGSLWIKNPFVLLQWAAFIAINTLISFMIGALRRARRRAEASEKLLKNVITMSPGAIYMSRVNAQGLTEEYLFTSDNFERVRGVPADRLMDPELGLAATTFPEDLPETRRKIQESLQKSQAGNLRFRIMHPQKGLIWLESWHMSEPLKDGGVILYGVLQDITERVSLEERLNQSQRLDAIGQLTGGIAHDFNNLLGVILGNVELLSEAVADRPDLHDLVDEAVTAIDHGATLTRSLLAYSRRQPLRPGPIDANAKVENLLPILRRTLGENIDIDFIPSPDLWFCDADKGQLENAILNLVLNGRYAMGDGGGKLTIETANVEFDETYSVHHSELLPGSYVMIAVSDTGCGMTPDTIKRAFEPFFTTKGVGEGTGLGLSTVFGFVKQSGGHVNIYSEPGQGTTVKLYLPRVAEETAEEIPVAALSDLSGSETVLVVEDNVAMRALTVRFLQSYGYRTLEAGTCSEALQELDRDDEIALILTDVLLPGDMDVRSMAAAALTARPHLKILYMSGYTENAIVHHGRLDKGVIVVQKPFRQRELGEKVRAILDTKSGMTEPTGSGRPSS